ncbi:universal stress protein [Candidatus Solincola tengchongensis]|uniref:universal stress protein n=1 Tax=Candidatus Solincola tengchongensis TaxID=2900693 RepID=UPI00257B9217|nr:universal stress protein [Candidatus Solincola tengchongensis]
MFSRLLIATDLSPASNAVVNCLGGLRAYGAGQCLLMMCLSAQEAMATALSYSIDAFEKAMGVQKEILEKQGFAVETRVVIGSAKSEVTRTADEEDYSLIVVGSQGHSLVGDMLLGGVAYGIIHSARRPVLVIPIRKKHHEENEPGNGCLPVERCAFTRHVLFPTDFSENADHAFAYVEKMAKEGARRVTILHVMDKEHLGHRLEEELVTDRLDTMEKILRSGSGVKIEKRIVYGSPFTEIIRTIREEDVQLVVMGSQGRGFIKEVFLGSVSHNVARTSDAPIMLVPYVR